MPPTLRPYQQAAVEETITGFRSQNFSTQLIVLPTGGGKTHVFAAVAAQFQPHRTLVLAHTDELIDQALQKIRSLTGLQPEREQSEHYASLNAPIVVASVATVARRLTKWPRNHFALLIVDEAHHIGAESYRRVLRHFHPHAKVLGVTATPDRADKRDLGFENIAYEATLFDLIADGYLSRIAIESVPLKIDLSQVQRSAGDFNGNDLGHAIRPYLRRIAQSIRSHAVNRRTLVFLPLVATSKDFVRICNEEGIQAAHVDGESSDRKEILTRFAAGEFSLLSNSMLLTEGFDDPGIDCIACLRPTQSRALFSQMIGRGTRVAPSKKNLLLLDFLWQHERHSLVRPAHLIATTQRQAQQITELSEGQPGAEIDLRDLAAEAQHRREEALLSALEENRDRDPRFVDAMEYALTLHEPDVADWEDTCRWHSEPMSDLQMRFLDGKGVDLNSVRNRGHAWALIRLIKQRQTESLATVRQLRMLRDLGHASPETATFDDAREFIAARLGKREAVTT